MAVRKMANHHALRVIAPTVRDHFSVNLTGKRLILNKRYREEGIELEMAAGWISEKPSAESGTTR